MIKIDLHTHSIISPDGAGSITEENFEQLIREGVLDCIAITDHNETSFALRLHKKLGDKIIVGEEIMTRDGEMIGLFLSKTISPGLSVSETVKEIHKQGGLVYIPHPFETLRKGLQKDVLGQIVGKIDILEVFNGRGLLRGKTKEATEFARANNLIGAASSDAHGYGGIGKTFSLIRELPTHKTLKILLQQGRLKRKYAPLWSYLYPVLNIIKNKFFK
ncbi:PHP domain-containing protein [Candidatus Roizmanbacteria bacterium]|nr:PHP domain-containing protein [Candidatus Roizmanbacteria bacterium]